MLKLQGVDHYMPISFLWLKKATETRLTMCPEPLFGRVTRQNTAELGPSPPCPGGVRWREEGPAVGKQQAGCPPRSPQPVPYCPGHNLRGRSQSTTGALITRQGCQRLRWPGLLRFSIYPAIRHTWKSSQVTSQWTQSWHNQNFYKGEQDWVHHHTETATLRLFLPNTL